MKIGNISLCKSYATFYGAYSGIYKQRYSFYFHRTLEFMIDIKRKA